MRAACAVDAGYTVELLGWNTVGECSEPIPYDLIFHMTSSFGWESGFGTGKMPFHMT